VRYGYRLVRPTVPRYTTYQALKFDLTTIGDGITINVSTSLRNYLKAIFLLINLTDCAYIRATNCTPAGFKPPNDAI